jgi:hypothetical protein
MRFRRAHLRNATTCLSRVAAAALLACATVFTPAALGLNSSRMQSEQNEQRSEIDSSEHFRATLNQTRRFARGRFHPQLVAGIVYVRFTALTTQSPCSVAQDRSNLSADSWSSPMRL